jgi:hypothetical protein
MCPTLGRGFRMSDGPHTAQPPADPWADSGHTFSYVRPGSTDELPDVTPPPRGVRRGWVYLALGVVVALVASGSALVGASVWFGWGGNQIEEIMPATTAAFVRVDLTPGLGQQLKFADLVKKFPERAGDGDRFKQSLLSDYDLEPLSYDTDIKPWFGDQVGAGVWSKDGAYSTSCTLVVLASRDDTAAAAALARPWRRSGTRRGRTSSGSPSPAATPCSATARAAPTASRTWTPP